LSPEYRRAFHPGAGKRGRRGCRARRWKALELRDSEFWFLFGTKRFILGPSQREPRYIFA
jgi:hypothetical protein